MKTVQDNSGNEITVPLNTPCYAGINGGLPRLYTSEEQVVIDAEQTAAKVIFDAGATVRNAKAAIAKLEANVTERRKREAILGTDNGWLAAQDALITIERNKL